MLLLCFLGKRHAVAQFHDDQVRNVQERGEKEGPGETLQESERYSNDNTLVFNLNFCVLLHSYLQPALFLIDVRPENTSCVNHAFLLNYGSSGQLF